MNINIIKDKVNLESRIGIWDLWNILDYSLHGYMETNVEQSIRGIIYINVECIINNTVLQCKNH